MSNVPKLRFKRFSGDWEKNQLLNIGKIITGSTPSTHIVDYYNGDKLFVSPSDMNTNRFINSTKTTLTELGFSKGRKVEKYSVCFVCIGSTIGKIGQLSEDSITNQQINCITANKDNSNDFIYSLLESNAPKIKLLAGVQAVPQINKTDFSKLKFMFPQKQEQEKIASFLNQIDIKIEQLTKKVTLLKEYKKGDYEEKHYHKIATEITVIVSGKVKMNGLEYSKGDIITIEPNEFTDFEALEDTVCTVVKYPGASDDKYLGEVK